MPNVAIFGSEKDFIVDRQALEETAKYFGASSVRMIDAPHDIMLGSLWAEGATELLTWLEESSY
jgi:hypothetical protein